MKLINRTYITWTYTFSIGLFLICIFLFIKGNGIVSYIEYGKPIYISQADGSSSDDNVSLAVFYLLLIPLFTRLLRQRYSINGYEKISYFGFLAFSLLFIYISTSIGFYNAYLTLITEGNIAFKIGLIFLLISILTILTPTHDNPV